MYVILIQHNVSNATFKKRTVTVHYVIIDRYMVLCLR